MFKVNPAIKFGIIDDSIPEVMNLDFEVDTPYGLWSVALPPQTIDHIISRKS